MAILCSPKAIPACNHAHSDSAAPCQIHVVVCKDSIFRSAACFDLQMRASAGYHCCAFSPRRTSVACPVGENKAVSSGYSKATVFPESPQPAWTARSEQASFWADWMRCRVSRQWKRNLSVNRLEQIQSPKLRPGATRNHGNHDDITIPACTQATLFPGSTFGSALRPKLQSVLDVQMLQKGSGTNAI